MEEGLSSSPLPLPVLVTVPGPVSHTGIPGGAFFFPPEQASVGHLMWDPLAAFLPDWEEPH